MFYFSRAANAMLGRSIKVRPLSLPQQRLFTPLRRNFGTTPIAHDASSQYVSAMFNAWKANPTAVHSSWDQYFKSNPTLEKPAQGQSTSQMQNRIQVGVHAQRILSTFRKYGHFYANLDPLGLKTKDFRKELVLSRLGVTEEDLDLPVTKADIDTALSADSKETLDDGYTLRDLIHNLETSYCGHVGVEYMHIQDRVQCNWIRTSIEKNIFTKSLDDNTYTPTKEERLSCLDRLTWGTLFEEFLGEKFQDKRYQNTFILLTNFC